MPYTKAKIEIAHIINNTRCGEESFLCDDRQAADKIIKYLESESLLTNGKVINMRELLNFQDEAVH